MYVEKNDRVWLLYLVSWSFYSNLNIHCLQALNEIIQDNGDPPKKKLYELKLSLLDEIGWDHLTTHEKEWMHVRFPPSLPLF